MKTSPDRAFIQRKASRVLKGVLVEDVVEADEHLIELLRSSSIVIRKEAERDAIDTGSQTLEAEYGEARAELLKALPLNAMDSQDLQKVLVAVDMLHHVLQEQIAFMEFQKRDREQIRRMHDAINASSDKSQ
jgi:hypothetical protein